MRLFHGISGSEPHDLGFDQSLRSIRMSERWNLCMRVA